MIHYIVRRLLWVFVILVVVTLFAFIVFYVLPPGDPASAFVGRSPTEDALNQVSREFGLNRPIPIQYLLFVKRLVLGDQYGWPGFGFSFATRVPIRSVILGRAWVTFQMAIGAAVVWLLLGIPIGIVSALRRRQTSDRLAMGFALFGVSAPVFWLGILSLYIFSYKLHLSPGTGYVAIGDSFTGWLTHWLMPWFVLALLFAAVYARMVRGNMLEVMSEDYIRTARAKGLPERAVVMRHALRSSLTPVVTLFGLDLGTLLGGAVVTERVFNIPGLGQYLVDGVLRGDLPIVMAVTVFAAIAVAVMNLIVDIVYAYLDPRVRYA